MNSSTNRELRQWILKIGVGVFTLALSMNVYFIKRLVDKIDRVDPIETEIALIKGDLSFIKMRLGFASTENFNLSIQSKTQKESGG